MMRLYLTGVIDLGGEWDARLPIDTRDPLRIPRGADVTLRVALWNSDGTRPSLVDAACSLAVRRSTRAVDIDTGFDVAATFDTGAREAVFAIAPGDTAALDGDRFVFDVWFTAGDGTRAQVVGLSSFTLAPSVVVP